MPPRCITASKSLRYSHPPAGILPFLLPAFYTSSISIARGRRRYVTSAGSHATKPPKSKLNPKPATYTPAVKEPEIPVHETFEERMDRIIKASQKDLSKPWREPDSWEYKVFTWKYRTRHQRRLVKGVREDVQKAIPEPEAAAEEEEEDTHHRIRNTAFPEPEHFPQDEVEIAYKHLQAARDARKRIKSDYAQFMGIGQRRSHYLYAVFPGAMEAVENEIRKVEEELDYLLTEREKYRTHRGQMRWLLDKGRRAEDVKAQMEAIKQDPDFPADLETYFTDAMGYLLLTRRLFRVSEVVLEGLARHGTPDEVGAAFSVLVNERLGKHQGPRVPFDPELDKVSARLIGLLDRIMAVRGEGRPIVLTRRAILQLINAVQVDLCAPAFWKILKAQGNDLEEMGVSMALLFCDRLCRPEFGPSRWKEAWEIARHFDGHENLLRPENRRILTRILNCSLAVEDHEATDEILAFITHETNFDPLEGLQAHHYEMSSALAHNDEERLRTAFSKILKSGEEATALSLSILHSFYKRNDNEIGRRDIMEQAMKHYRPDDYILAQMLHGMVLAGAPYPEIFRAYRQHYRTGLLRHFSISLDADLDPAVNSPDELQKRIPDHVILTIMIQAYCYNSTPHRIWELYEKYHSYVSGHRKIVDRPIFNRLIKNGTYTPHIFMFALSKHKHGLQYISYILEDMLRPTARIQADVYTWSIFLRALVYNNQIEPAERVIATMKEHGIQPNVITWTSLLAAYMKAAAPEMAEPVLAQMESDGVKPNAMTWKTIIHGWATAEEKNPWKVGDAFRRMIEAGFEPDEQVLEDVAGFQEDVRFVAAVSGESEVAEGVFEEGEVRWPEVRTREEVEREREERRLREVERIREAERLALLREEEEMRRRKEGEDVFETGELSWPTPEPIKAVPKAAEKDGESVWAWKKPEPRVASPKGLDEPNMQSEIPSKKVESFFDWKIRTPSRNLPMDRKASNKELKNDLADKETALDAERRRIRERRALAKATTAPGTVLKTILKSEIETREKEEEERRKIRAKAEEKRKMREKEALEKVQMKLSKELEKKMKMVVEQDVEKETEHMDEREAKEWVGVAKGQEGELRKVEERRAEFEEGELRWPEPVEKKEGKKREGKKREEN